MHTFLIKLILKIKTQVSKRQLCIWLHAESLIAAAVNPLLCVFELNLIIQCHVFLTYSALSDVILNLWLLMFVFISLIRRGSIQNHWRKKKATHRNVPPSSYFEISMLDKRNIDFFFFFFIKIPWITKMTKTLCMIYQMLLVVLTNANNQNFRIIFFLLYCCEKRVVGITLKKCLMIDTDGRRERNTARLLNALN